MYFFIFIFFIYFFLKEALKLQQDMRKKKQEMLETQIECQKVGLALTPLAINFSSTPNPFFLVLCLC